VAAEVGHIPYGHSLDREGFPVRLAEPPDEFPKVVSDRPASVIREVVTGEIGGDERRLFIADEQPVENIIVRILTAFWTGIGHHVDTPER
jgi:hypothetical protein